ncbi:MAG: UDP-3-O-acyl-N-acetylglucosamine deacetylase [Alphaproteobacteria bacterium]|nr:UDP-3-O-acyl-N-acetylglucosamine deacetylase [Alphaproteobacteria bacterium]
MRLQTTLRHIATLSGIGLHSGSTVSMRLLPGAADSGIVFRRMDVEPLRSMIAARYDAVCDTRLGTTICNAHGVSVSTIEHLMAALWGAGLDNVLIELDAPEVPIMDGSSAPFVELLEHAGVTRLAAPKRILRVLKAVEVRDGESFARIAPNREGDEGMALSIAVEYDNAVIGRQSAFYDFRESTFAEELSRARTFGFAHEVEALQKAGLALGGSLENAIVVGEESVLNAEGLRFDDEFVRHKALDCVGDLFLAGLRIDGALTFVRPGHGINNKLVRALMADESAYEIVASEALPVAAASVARYNNLLSL